MAKPLRVAFAEALKQFEQIENSVLKHISDEFQKELTETIQQWLLLQRAIESNFSDNETLEDLNTSELKYLSVEYYIAQLYTILSEPSRERNLKKAILLYLAFLKRLQDYGLLEKRDIEKIDIIKKNPFKIASFHESAATTREEKINDYKLEKSLASQLSVLEKLENNEQEYANADEDQIRQLYFDSLRLFTLRSFSNIRLATQELEILEFAPKAPQIEEIKDDREESRNKDSTKFTEKLESVGKVKEFLSKDGKILKPFTIMKREDLKKKVYGTGQYLPTMTVEDYLEQELANGGMVSSAPEQEESSDEDDYEKNDRDTYKAREWDEFTETHKKGSGNTINRG